MARCAQVVDEANADFAEAHGRPTTRLQLNHLGNLTFRDVVAATDATEPTVKELVAKGVSYDTIADIVFSSIRKRILPPPGAKPSNTSDQVAVAR